MLTTPIAQYSFRPQDELNIRAESKEAATTFLENCFSTQVLRISHIKEEPGW